MILVAIALALAAVPVPTRGAPPAADISFRPVSSTEATLALRMPAETKTARIDTIDAALILLADRDYEPIWPQVIAWAGPGLETLRDALVQKARAAHAKGRAAKPGKSLAALVDPKRRPTILLAEALTTAGRQEEAERLITHMRGITPGSGTWPRMNWVTTSLWLAMRRYDRGDAPGALAMLDASLAAMDDDRIRLNLEANRAAIFVETGRASEALAAIDAIEARFLAPGGGGLFAANARIGGSDRHFAWIRACALAKLGRTTEARAAQSPLSPGSDPTEKRFPTSPTNELRQRLARCTGDVAAAARAYADDLAGDPFTGRALIELQSGLAHPLYDTGLLARVRQHPAIAASLARRMRPLPPELLPALHAWRTVAGGDRPAIAGQPPA